MATIVNMPRLSDTMEEGVLAQWLKNIGDKIEEGDILAEIETDKATMEFESFYEGTLLYKGVKEGETAAVDSLLAIIGEEGEDISALLSKNNLSSPTAEEQNNKPKQVKTENILESSEILNKVNVINMPRLSDTMTEGTVAHWLKKVGDKVEEGDILAEIETDKATMEFESFYEGTLLHIGVEQGNSASVDSLLAIIGEANTDISSLVKSSELQNANLSSAEAKKASKTLSSNDSQTYHTSSEESANTTDKGRILASPLAKKIAKDKGIELSTVKGSGENGRIVKKDIENYKLVKDETASSNKIVSSNIVSNVSRAVLEESVEEVKNSQMRKAIVKSLTSSKFSAPHFYLNIEVDMTSAIASRLAINAMPNTKVSFNDLVVKACAIALKKHPQINTSWSDASTQYYSHIHIGVAVAVSEGLVVPVLKHADSLSLTEIGSSVRDLAEKARNKKIKPEQMQGSTFTVSNLGMFGIESFTSIINQPNAAILSVGAIVEKPVVKNAQIAIGNTMKLTLACDHRTVDGAVGAQFLQTLKIYLENPVTMLA
ncbi:MAG: 2-oxo acid dehydrogenase subunit E2 [Tenacibaculum sp.]